MIFKKQKPYVAVINIIYVIVSLLFFALLWTLKILEDRHVITFHTLAVQILVPGYVGITCIYSLLNRNGKNIQMLITAALLFAMVAEIINACNLSYGLLFFSLTHLCLTIYHWTHTKVSKKFEIVSLIIISAISLIAILAIELNLHTTNIEYELVVPLYTFILALMVWRSICTWGTEQCYRIIIGSILFYACDIFILAELTSPDFQNPPLYLLILSWVTYFPALFSLSLIEKPIFIKNKK
ncbi:MAG: lysoplasmalogenase [Mycoplasmataceae bacterium]|nr:lysoplasmalogenase [Mycoplasmataceae bacterium]